MLAQLVKQTVTNFCYQEKRVLDALLARTVLNVTDLMPNVIVNMAFLAQIVVPTKKFTFM